jgi:hypothetical protein
MGSNRLGIDGIVLLVRSHEADIDRVELVVNPHDEPVFVASDIEYNTAIQLPRPGFGGTPSFVYAKTHQNVQSRSMAHTKMESSKALSHKNPR